MAKNALTTGKSKFCDVDTILRDPNKAARLTNLVDEAVNCKSAIAAQQQNIKALRETALDDLGMAPALFNAYVAAAFNNDYTTRKESLNQQVTLMNYLTGEVGLQIPADREVDGE